MVAKARNFGAKVYLCKAAKMIYLPVECLAVKSFQQIFCLAIVLTAKFMHVDKSYQGYSFFPDFGFFACHV
jgi:hypothetical protein